MSETRHPPAFAAEAFGQRGAALLKSLWWTAASAATRRLVPHEDTPVDSEHPLPGRAAIRRAYAEAFEKEQADVAAGLYPPLDTPRPSLRALERVVDLVTDARAVEARRQRNGATEARAEASDAYPVYYRQNFHFQTGGWFTQDSARRYEDQVEALFAGSGAAMRRRALSLLARAWRGRDHRGLRVLDLACGSGAFLADLRATFPRAQLCGLDLSPTYLAETRRRSGVGALVQAPAERLPFADGSLDAVTCVYLFHELPPRVRTVVAREIARVLKPGGLLAFADSVQHRDEPELARMLDAFPVFFHEPYYASYQATDLAAMFAEAGLALQATDKAFLTKAWLFGRVT
jgi:ubiquinone/menaquinone biosynthesis C-methylase UbiE